jgi:nucleosome binding factor SPN SPT16 subunit
MLKSLAILKPRLDWRAPSIVDLLKVDKGVVQQKKPTMWDKMTKSLGSVSDVEFCDSSLVITPSNRAVKKEIVLNINPGFFTSRRQHQDVFLGTCYCFD